MRSTGEATLQPIASPAQLCSPLRSLIISLARRIFPLACALGVAGIRGSRLARAGGVSFPGGGRRSPSRWRFQARPHLLREPGSVLDLVHRPCG